MNAQDGPAYDWAVLHDPQVASIPPPTPQQMGDERYARDAAAIGRASAQPPPTLRAVEDAPDPRNDPGWEESGASVERIQNSMARSEASAFGAVTLADIPHERPAPLLLDRIAPDGHTILFGDGGIGKGVVVASWLCGLVTGGHTPLVLDYENNGGEWSRRVHGLDGPEASEGVFYISPTASGWDGAMWEHINAIRRVAMSVSATVVVIDSIIVGCHGHDASDTATASAYSRAVASLGVPVLSIGHNTKAGAGRHPFGSVVWHNAARFTWSLERVAGGLLLRNRKSNNYRTPPRYLVSMTWRDDLPREVWEKQHAEAVTDAILELLDEGPLARAAIIDRLNDDRDEDEAPVKPNTVKSALHRARASGLIALDSDKWRRT